MKNIQDWHEKYPELTKIALSKNNGKIIDELERLEFEILERKAIALESLGDESFNKCFQTLKTGKVPKDPSETPTSHALAAGIFQAAANIVRDTETSIVSEATAVIDQE